MPARSLPARLRILVVLRCDTGDGRLPRPSPGAPGRASPHPRGHTPREAVPTAALKQQQSNIGRWREPRTGRPLVSPQGAAAVHQHRIVAADSGGDRLLPYCRAAFAQCRGDRRLKPSSGGRGRGTGARFGRGCAVSAAPIMGSIAAHHSPACLPRVTAVRSLPPTATRSARRMSRCLSARVPATLAAKLFEVANDSRRPVSTLVTELLSVALGEPEVSCG